MSTDDGYSYEIPRWNDVEWGSATFPVSPSSPAAPPPPAPASRPAAPRPSAPAASRPAPAPQYSPPTPSHSQPPFLHEVQQYGPPAGQPLARRGRFVPRNQPPRFDQPAEPDDAYLSPQPHAGRRPVSIGRWVGGFFLILVGFSFLQAGIQVMQDYPGEPGVGIISLMIPVAMLAGGFSLLRKGRRR